MTGRRDLTFDRLDQIMPEVDRLLADGAESSAAVLLTWARWEPSIQHRHGHTLRKTERQIHQRDRLRIDRFDAVSLFEHFTYAHDKILLLVAKHDQDTSRIDDATRDDIRERRRRGRRGSCGFARSSRRGRRLPRFRAK